MIDPSTVVLAQGLGEQFGEITRNGPLILGFLAAALKAVISVKYPNASPDRAFDTSEIRRSLKGSLKELMNDDQKSNFWVYPSLHLALFGISVGKKNAANFEVGFGTQGMIKVGYCYKFGK